MFLYFCLENKEYVDSFKFELKYEEGKILNFSSWTERKETIITIVKNLIEMSLNLLKMHSKNQS